MLNTERTSEEILREISGLRSEINELHFKNDIARHKTPGDESISQVNARIADLEVRLATLSPLYWEARRAEGLGGPFENDNKTKSCF